MEKIQRLKDLGAQHPLVLAIVLFVVWVILLWLFSITVNPILVGGLGDDPAWLRFALEAESLISVVITVFIGRVLFGNGNTISSVKHICLVFTAGITIGILWFVLSFGVLVLVGIAHIDSALVVQNIFVWISACFINAAFQEVLFRGYLFDLLAKGKNEVIATIITTIVFTLFHPGAFLAGPIAVFQIALASIFLTLLRLVTCGITASIAVHASWNVLGGIVFGVVNLAADYPALFIVQMTGAWFLTGASMGLEGSLVTLLATSVLCCCTYALKRHLPST